jgi:ornithine--oxo-acid transaminase
LALPQIIEAMVHQSKKLTLTSRAFFNDALGEYEEYITKMLGYDKVRAVHHTASTCGSTHCQAGRQDGRQASRQRERSCWELSA